MLDSPLTVKVYDKDFNFKAFVGDPISLVVTPRYNQTGTATLVVDLDHHAAPHLLADGARLVISLYDEQLMSGKIHQRHAQGPSLNGTLTIYLKDDFRLLHQVLGWPVPAAAITTQGASEYATYTGNAESIVKAAVMDNMVARLGLPVEVAPNQDRGATVPDGVKLRFHPLYEQLFPAVEKAGIGVTLRQGFDMYAGSIVCDVFVPPSFAYTLSEDGGMLASWTWTDEDPTATRVVAGGGGDGVDRIFRQAIDAALETAHRSVAEGFQDARDADDAAMLQTRATEGLTEGEPKAGFAIQLSESANFRYGKHGLVVGARVTVRIGDITHTDILREVTLSYTRDGGLVTTPIVGDIADSPDRTIANFLARLKKGINNLKVSK